MNIELLVSACVSQIETSHQAREQALAISRTLIRQCANTIRATHRAEYEAAAELLKEAAATADRLHAVVADQPHVSMAGYTQDALKEYAEAALVYAFLTGGTLPSAETLNVEAAAFLNGLSEAASELRRAILNRLRRGEVRQSEALLTVMDEVYSLLMTVDYPDAVTGGLRRATDALRGVLERTRGDVTAAIRQERLMAALAAFEQRTMGSTEGAQDTTQQV
jgi:translin